VTVTVGVRPNAEVPAGTGRGGSGKGGGGDRKARTTPYRLAAATAATAVALLALLGVTVGSFTTAQNGTAGVAQHAAVASDAADLYFSLSDLDAEAARLVLLGNGGSPVAGGQDHSGDQLSALTAYNARTAQVDADLQRLAATAGSADSPAVATLTGGVTTYHQIADAAIALDQTAPSDDPTRMGAPAGEPAAGAIGYYARATTLMQSTLLPAAEHLREGKAAELASASDDAHLAGIVGACAAGVFGLLALVLALRTHRRLRLWFRRSVNLGVLAAGALAVALGIGSVAALATTASDAQSAGSRFASYLAVTHTRAASYDVDGAVTRYLLMPDTGTALVTKALDAANTSLKALGADGAVAAGRWSGVTGKDIPAIVQQNLATPDGVATALDVATGIARGKEAFDFYYYDQALLSLSDQRLAAFDTSMNAAHDDLSGWSWLPWALAVVGLGALALGVRPRFAEYR
jgi:hypothetical protein